MSVGIVGGIAQVVRMELDRAQQLSAMVGRVEPEVAQLIQPGVPSALDGALAAVNLLRERAPQSVHVDIGTQRVLKQINLAIDDVERGVLPREDRFRFALLHLNGIPGAST